MGEGGEEWMDGSWPVAALDLPKSSTPSSIGPSTLHQGSGKDCWAPNPNRHLSLRSISGHWAHGSKMCPSSNKHLSKSRRIHHRFSPPLHLPGCSLSAVFAIRKSRSGLVVEDRVRVPIVSPRPSPLRQHLSLEVEVQISSSPPSSSSMRSLPGWPTPLPLSPPGIANHRDPPFCLFHATNCLDLLAPGTLTFLQRHGFAPHQITSEILGLAQLPVLSAPLPAHPSETAKRPSPLPSPWTPKPSKPPHLRPRSISQPPSSRIGSRRYPSSPTTSPTSSARRRSKPSCTRYLDQSPLASPPSPATSNQAHPRLRRPPRLDGGSCRTVDSKHGPPTSSRTHSSIRDRCQTGWSSPSSPVCSRCRRPKMSPVSLHRAHMVAQIMF